MTLTLEERVLVPVADQEDAERTAAAIGSYLGPESTAVMVNVVEKGSSPDAETRERHTEQAEEMFDRARSILADTPGSLETEVLFGVDIVETIFEEAKSQAVDAVVFLPREESRLVDLLAGDMARRMVKEAPVAVLALPNQE